MQNFVSENNIGPHVTVTAHVVRLEPIKTGNAQALRNLVQLYFHDFSEYDREDVNEIGQFNVPWINEYLAEPGRAYLITVDAKIAGFVLVDEDVLCPVAKQAVSEFFILRKYRRNGIGLQVANLLFATRAGSWEASVIHNNRPAAEFWSAVAQHENQFSCQYMDWNNDEWYGPVFLFTPR